MLLCFINVVYSFGLKGHDYLTLVRLTFAHFIDQASIDRNLQWPKYNKIKRIRIYFTEISNLFQSFSLTLDS